MGVKLKDLITSTQISINDLKGTRVAIDGMNMLFQILYNPAQRQKGLPNTYYYDSTHRVITHLYGWLQKLSHFYSLKILPVVVFDGKPDAFKRLETKNRAHDYNYAKKEYEKAMAEGDHNAAKFFANSRSFLFPNCVKESIELLRYCGCPVINAPSESEAQCAALQQAGVVQYVISNDYDTLLFGASSIVRKLTFAPQFPIQLINLQENLDTLEITREQLIDISILLGNDYFREGIPNIGPKTALKSIHAYQSIPNMIKKHPALFTELPLAKYRQILSLFLKPISIDIEKISLGPFNHELLVELLLHNHTLNPDRVKRALDKFGKRHQRFYNNINRTAIENPSSPFFLDQQPARNKEIKQATPKPQFDDYDDYLGIKVNPSKTKYTANVALRRHLDRAKVKTPKTPISTSFISADRVKTKKK
jgi:flap endonuclease-1